MSNSPTGRISGRGTFIFTGGLSNDGQVSLSAGFSDVFGAVTNNAGGRIIITGGGTATFYDSVDNNTGSEFRVSTGCVAVFLSDVEGNSFFTGGGTKYFEAGVSDLGDVWTPGSTVVQEPATVRASSFREAALTVNGQVTIADNGRDRGVSVLNALDIGGPGSLTGRLDLRNNDLIVDYAAAGSSPVEAVKEWITAGFNYGSWDGFGITTGYINSPDPGGDPNDAGDMYTRGVGYMQNDQCLYGPYSEFSGQAVDDSTVLVKYTRLGDLNLDGVVNDMDVTVLGLYYDYDPNTGEHPLGPIWHWWEGDLNYDGYVDDVDVTLLGLNYDVEAAPLSDSPTSIPEPGTLCLLALGALCGWARQPRIWRVAAATARWR
jgi:hypothetical protein